MSLLLPRFTEKYGLPQSQIRAYFHYQPSFYHLHVHFTLASYNAPGSSVEGAHLLPVVIRNIEADPAHYQRATLPFPVKESDNLFAHYKKGGYAFGEEEEKKEKVKLFPICFPIHSKIK